MDVTNCINCEFFACTRTHIYHLSVCSLFNNGCLGYIFLENCYDFICHKTVVSPFQYLLATLHPALMVDCVMNPSLDSIAHVSKDIMERFAKLKVD